MSAMASLTGTEVGFCAAVATIIPMFFLAYVGSGEDWYRKPV